MRETIEKSALEIFHSCSGNKVYLEKSARETVLYDAPLIGFTDALDPIFASFKNEEIIGSGYMTPTEWLPEAKTVISFFFPFTEDVRKSNYSGETPSEEWLYARIEGQEFINRFISALADHLNSAGITNCVPSGDPRFKIIPAKQGDDVHMISTWSERHAAYACGLGTFGISRGIITKKGTAGRFCSIIIDKFAEPTIREYTGVYDYCTLCGDCISNCPPNAISLEHGKNNILCSKYLDEMGVIYKPRYGCGKCQVNVRCECGIPLK